MDGTEKNTARNVKQSGEFVVNTVSPAFLEQVCSSAEEFETEADRFGHVGLLPGQCKMVKAPRVTEALASLECVLFKCVELGEGDGRTDLFIGRIVYVHLSDARNTGRRSATRRQVPLLAALDLDWYLLQGEAVFRPQAQRPSNGK
jgi:flavin reductase (DIM6/NTAB) family NADH-FMN oxidoreductase RutF